MMTKPLAWRLRPGLVLWLVPVLWVLPLRAAPLAPVSQAGSDQRNRYVDLAQAPGTDADLDSIAPTHPTAVVKGELLVRFRPNVSRLRQQSVVAPLGGRVKYFNRSGTRSPALQLAAAKESVFDQLALVQLEPQADLNRALKHVAAHPDVLYAEPNYRVQIAQAPPAPVIPNDFDFSQLWGLHNAGQRDGTAGADIGAPFAWEETTGDRRVVVAVIDTGIDYYHPDLVDNVWTNPKETPGNGVDDDGNGYIDDLHGYDFLSDDGDPMDDHGHGTHVSGTIGAVGNNGFGVAGVCWQVSLMAIKAFDETGNGDIDKVIEGIHYAIQNGARIINASWGSADKSRALEEAINEAYRAGLIMITAGGNENSDNLFYPAAYPHTVGVAATDAKDQRARFSNFGSFIDVAAPGENIYSTLPNNSYGFFSGTSMATPHVSGVAALVLARHPELTNDQLENILRNAVDPITPDKYIGTGRINAGLAARVNRPLPEVKLALPNTIYGNIDIPGSATGNDFAGYSLEYGKGTNPTNWTAFYNSAAAVPGGTLYPNFSTPRLDEGTYTFRLTAHNVSGEQAVERASVQISNVHISSPGHNDIVRAGESIPIRGTVFGENRTYRIEYGVGPQPTSWSDAGVQLAGSGATEVRDGVLATWDTGATAPNQFYTLRLTATTASGVTTENISRLIYLDSHLKAGWPQYLPVTGTYPPEDWRHVTVADIDGDGRDELILVDHGNSDGAPARLLVYRADGTLFWTKELAAGFPYADIPVVGDVDGDGLMEIFVDVGSDGQLFAFRYDGSPLPGHWPVKLEATGLGKVLADLDGDGKKEIIGFSQNTVNHGGESEYRQLVVFDIQGNLLRKWEVPACSTDLELPRMLPAVGNLDQDPELEIVAVSGCDTLAAFKLSHPSTPIWTARTYGTFVASPVIGDLAGGGTNNVIIAAYDTSSGDRGGVYAFSGKGERLPGWPVLIEESFTATPALGDFGEDGRLEISIPSSKSNLLHLLRSDGFEMPGWPIGPVNNSSVNSSPVIGDVDGDGHPDVVLSSPGYMSLVQSTGDASYAGGVKAWRRDGEPIRLSGTAEPAALVMESSAGATWMKGAPVTLADIDHNGKLDIIAASVQDRTYLPAGEKSARKNRSSIYVWELNVPFVPEHNPWPAFQANPEHTGSVQTRRPPDQPPVVLSIASQIIAPGTGFFPIELDQYVEDPDNAPREISWSVSGQRELQVTISSNRVALVQVPSSGWTGMETLRFLAWDPAGLSDEATATFEVRNGYVGPLVVADRARTMEDTATEIDVLANDADPGGFPLSVAGWSKPAFGTVRLTPRGTLLYTPKPDANGHDTFSYTVANGHGGMAMGSVMVEIVPVNDPPVANPDHVIIDEDTSVDIDVLSNDSDPDQDPITLIGFTAPEHGSVVKTPNNLFHYLPSTNYYGLDSFTYTISDGHGETSQATVSIIVKPVNDPPVALDQRFVLNRNSSQNINFLAVDPDDTELTFSIVDSPAHGTLWNYPKVATYYPTNGFVGTDRFTYRANDGKDDSAPATVFLTVLDVNNPPAVTDQSVVTKVDQAASIQLAATDLDNDPLTYQILTPPAHGRLTGTGTNYLYQPDLGFLGGDKFTFQASDGKDLSPPGTVTIKVTDQNSAPTANDFSVRTLVSTSTNITLQASDPESDPLSFHVLTRPSNGKLTGKGQILLYSPKAYFVGSDRFTFKVSDGELESNVGTVTITVDPANRAPVVTNQTVVALANRPTVILLNVQDPDGDPVHCPILKGPKSGRVSGLGSTFTYQPKADFVGTDSFTYKAWDGQTYSREATVTVSVVSGPPTLSLAFQAVIPLADGQVRLLLTTPVNQQAEVLVSSDLVQWTPLPTGTTDGGVTSVIDAEAAKFPHRFYQARQRPPGP